MNLKRDEETRVFTKITPQMAQEFLNHNASFNRTPTKNKVKEYADLMESGKWNENISRVHDPIVISTNGELINGQHRCMAIVRANVTIGSMVVFGVPADTYQYFDGGVARKAGDFIEGKNKNAIAALAKLQFALENGTCPLLTTMSGQIHPMRNEHANYAARIDIIKTAESDYTTLDYYLKLGWKLSTHFGKKSVYSFALMLIDFVGRGEVIEEFVEDFSKTVSSSASNTACKIYMGGYFVSNKKSDSKWILGTLLSAYEYYRNGDLEKTIFNQQRYYLDRYDEYLRKERKNRRGGK